MVSARVVGDELWFHLVQINMTTLFIATLIEVKNASIKINKRTFVIERDGNEEALQTIEAVCQQHLTRPFKVGDESSSLIDFLLLSLRLADDGSGDWAEVLDKEYAPDRDGLLTIDNLLTIEIIDNTCN